MLKHRVRGCRGERHDIASQIERYGGDVDIVRRLGQGVVWEPGNHQVGIIRLAWEAAGGLGSRQHLKGGFLMRTFP